MKHIKLSEDLFAQYFGQDTSIWLRKGGEETPPIIIPLDAEEIKKLVKWLYRIKYIREVEK